MEPTRRSHGYCTIAHHRSRPFLKISLALCKVPLAASEPSGVSAWLGGSSGPRPVASAVGIRNNRGDDFIHFPITTPQGNTQQATYIQVVDGPDPLIIGLIEDSNKVYTKPLYAKPHVGHAGQHCLDRVINELKDRGLKAELKHYRQYQHKAERVEQRLHSLAQSLGGIQLELKKSKYRLEMADVIKQVSQMQEGWMSGIGPMHTRHGRRS
ncbi:hypothetical protein EDB89DRAFT_1914725 [Lactarius sanguifluus]|nr:hypothetical protein EDB89DRAFT_1914725 [Lactarius sanguifluus]